MSSLTLLDALQTVHFGDVTPDQFLNATQAGRPASASGPLEVRSTGVERLKAALDAPEGRLIWEGPIPDKAGRYIVTNPYATNQLKSHDPQELLIGLGLTNTAIGEISGICTEVDEALDGGLMPLEEQAALYDALEAATGLRFSAAVLSGDARQSALGQLQADETLEKGKSLHVWLSCDWEAITPERLILRQKAADILCAIVGGDPATRDLARKMRVGGVTAKHEGRVRVQTCLRADPTAVQPLQAIHDALAGYAASQGLDVAKRLDALQTAAQCRKRARAWERACAEGKVLSSEADDAAQTLTELALEIRQGGEVKPSHRRLMALVGLPNVGSVQITTQTGAVRTISTGHQAGWDASTTVITHTSGQSGLASTLWATMRRGYRVPDIHCIGHADAHASAYLRGWKGGFSIHCPSCGVIESAPIGWASQGHTGSQTGPGSAQDLYVVPEPAGLGTSKVKLYVPAPGEMEAYYAAQVAECQARADERAHKALHDPMEMAKNLHFKALTESEDVMQHVASERADQVSEGVMANLCDDAVEDGIDRVIHTSTIKEYMNKSIKLMDGCSTIDEHLIELALTRYNDKGVDCPNGPTAARAHLGGFHMWRLACRRRTCAVCGPRWRRAERAAIAASIATLGDDWLGASMESGPSDEGQLRRWAGKDLSKRAFLRVRFSPDEQVTLLFWAPGNEPGTRTAARFITHKFVRDWAAVVADQIHESVQPGPDQQAVSGTPALTKQINLLRDTLLGRKKLSIEKTFITNGSAQDVRDRVKKNIAKENTVGHVEGVTHATLQKKISVPVFVQEDPWTSTPTPAPVITQALEDSHIFRGQAKKKTVIHFTKGGFISLVADDDTDEPELARSTS